MRERDPGVTWRPVPFDKKTGILDRVNKILEEEGIPTVQMDVIGWRFNRVFGNLKLAECMHTSPSRVYVLKGNS